jgi:chromosome segregation ATPase
MMNTINRAVKQYQQNAPASQGEHPMTKIYVWPDGTYLDADEYSGEEFRFKGDDYTVIDLLEITARNTRNAEVERLRDQVNAKNSEIESLVDRLQESEDENGTLRRERDQMEARLGHCQRFLASGILYTYDELLRHDADVIDRACSELELRARKYGYYYTINLIQMREYANQLRQQAKED